VKPHAPFNCPECGTLPPSEGDCPDCDERLENGPIVFLPTVPPWNPADRAAIADIIARALEEEDL
jgi:hypothetical protein